MTSLGERLRDGGKDAFAAAFGGVYEHSPWIAEAVWEGPGGVGGLADTEALIAAMAAAVAGAPHERKLALLRAHPDLAGRLAVAGELTEASTREQASAGLDHCTQDEFEAFQAMNVRYVDRFGFPFILAVKGHDRASILAAFEMRLDNTPRQELAEALVQVDRIAAFRIRDAVASLT